MQDNYTLYSQNDYYTVVEVSGMTTPADAINIITNAINIGTGEGLFSGKTGHNLLFKSFVAGDNITIESSASGITINSTGGGSGGGSITGATNGLNLSGEGSLISLGGALTGDTTILGANTHSLFFGQLGGEELVGLNIATTGGYNEWQLGEGILGLYSVSTIGEGYGAIQIYPYGVQLNGGNTGGATLEMNDLGFRASSGIGEVSLYGSEVPVKLSVIKGGASPKITSLTITPDETPTIIADSDEATFSGVQYGQDFSASYTDRSLTDKGYVDNKIVELLTFYGLIP